MIDRGGGELNEALGLDFLAKVCYNGRHKLNVGRHMKVNILKSLVLILLSSFVGIMANPEILTASDSVTISGIDDSNVVQTVVQTPEAPSAGVVETPAVKSVAQATLVATKSVAQATLVATKTAAAKPVTTAPSNNVKFSWGTFELFRASNTAVNSGNKVARYNNLIWGHNYTAFGKITSLKIGDTFTITENGATVKYKVAKNPVNGAAGVVLEKKSDTELSYAGDARYDSINMNALVRGMGHSLVLMTCYGSNSRYVVVADQI